MYLIFKCNHFKFIFSITGIIPHSARPPSTNQSHARLTFVAKVSVDEMVGRQKAFREEMRHFQPLVMPESMPNLMEQGQGAITRPASLKVS